jgi:hypothetical protein
MKKSCRVKPGMTGLRRLKPEPCFENLSMTLRFLSSLACGVSNILMTSNRRQGLNPAG